MNTASLINPVTAGEPARAETARNPTPGRRAYIRRLLWSPAEFRKFYILFLLLLTPLLLTVHARIEGRSEAIGGISLVGGPGLSPEFLPIFLDSVFRVMVPFFAVIWANSVWKAHPFGKRDYSWSLPVDRPTHDLWRVAAGAVHLLCALALIVLFGGGFTLFEGIPLFPRGSWPFWINFFCLPVALYAVASIPNLCSKSPGIWILGMITAAPLAVVLVGLSDLSPLENTLRILIIGEGPGSDGMALYPTLSHGTSSGTAAWIADYADTNALSEVTLSMGLRMSVVREVPELRSWGSHLTWLLASALWMMPVLGGLWLAARRRI